MEENEEITEETTITLPEDDNQNVGFLFDIRQPFNSKDVIENIIDNVVEGRIEPTKVGVILKRMEKVSKAVLENKKVKEIINDSFDKYMTGTTNSVKLYSATIVKMPVWTGYNFDDCGHPELNELYKIQKEVEDRIKGIEEELKLMIPKVEKNQVGLGIKDTGKTVLIEAMPKLIWEESGEALRIEAPKKLQKIGLKYMKI